MPKAKAGRKKKIGARHPGGQLVQRIPANDKVLHMRDRFAVFDGGKKQPDQLYDPIGRAWAVGLLDGTHIDPVVIRDTARTYARLYWQHWPSASGIAQYGEMVARGSVSGPSSENISNQSWFRRLDEALRKSGRPACNAVHGLCVNSYHFPDDDPLWLGRLILEAQIRRKVPVAGRLPGHEDHVTMRAALEGILAMVA